MRLADEIMSALPGLVAARPLGPTIGEIAARLAAPDGYVREAMIGLEADKRAKIVRRGKSLHLLPIDHPTRVCCICRAEVVAERKSTVTCSHSCGRKLAWQNPEMREKHRRSVKAALQEAERRAKMTTKSRRYWARQENREAASEAIRKTWQDPEVKGRRLVGIDKAWESEERRTKQSKRRIKDWQNEEFREKTVAAMRNGKRGMVKRKVLALAAADPDTTPAMIAAALGVKRDRVLHILRKARREGVIGVRPGDGPRLQKRTERRPS